MRFVAPCPSTVITFHVLCVPGDLVHWRNEVVGIRSDLSIFKDVLLLSLDLFWVVYFCGLPTHVK